VKHHKKWSREKILEIIRACEAPGANIEDICRVYGVHVATFYRWRKRFDEIGTPPDRQVKDLEAENQRLKELLAQRDLELDAMQRVLRKNSPRHSSGGTP